MDKKTKNVVIAVALTLAAVIAYKIFKKPSNDNEGGNNTGGSSGGGGGGKTSGLNFTSLANDLYQAMDNYGTAENGITDIMKLLKNNADFDALSSAYGTRTLNCGSFNPFCTDFTGNMVQSLNDELDSSEIKVVNQILASNGLTRKI